MFIQGSGLAGREVLEHLRHALFRFIRGELQAICRPLIQGATSRIRLFFSSRRVVHQQVACCCASSYNIWAFISVSVLGDATYRVWLFGDMPIFVIHRGPGALLVTGVSLGQREADNKTGSGRCLDPHLATVVENSSAGERQP